MPTASALMVEARRVLLDALEVLENHRDSLVLVGAQAVYLSDWAVPLLDACEATHPVGHTPVRSGRDDALSTRYSLNDVCHRLWASTWRAWMPGPSRCNSG